MLETIEDVKRYMDAIESNLTRAFEIALSEGPSVHISILAMVLGVFKASVEEQNRFAATCANFARNEMARVMGITSEEFDKRLEEDPDSLRKEFFKTAFSTAIEDDKAV